ncbi:VPLPA-CTERM sorting domain-containing protein [Frigidibacter sp. MR17.14]|uniref:VPLPA-CTERM sorting domain-containing protein n=1 Tax=Frigidibacter sp. MR17.14 TaxID=3126509 RepID=UPI003012F4B1
MKTLALAAVSAVALSSAAGAATLAVDEANYDGALLTPNSSYSTTWTSNGTSWDIQGFSFTLNGLSGGNDLPLVTLSFDDGSGAKTYSDWDIKTSGSRATGTMFLDGFVTDADFTIGFDYGDGAKNVFANYVFDATVATDGGTDPGPAPVPLPAAGVLLLAGVGGLAGVKRLRRKG